MFDKINQSMKFAADVLQLRARRQEVLTSNISNADTPNYKAVDFDFKQALQKAEAPKGAGGAGSTPNDLNLEGGLAVTHTGHIAGTGGTTALSTDALLKYRQGVKPSLDNNTVDVDRERAAYTENTVKYELALRSINGRIAAMKQAMESK